MSQPRVVITGIGQVSPLGIDNDVVWQVLQNQTSCIRKLQRIPANVIPTSVGGEATEFTGAIEQFGELEKIKKRTIKKGMKLMCREISMAVAAAQHALNSAGYNEGGYEPEKSGCVFGSDYIMTTPDEFEDGINKCREHGKLQFERWGSEGLPKVDPLWLLKYLPNMPASHVAIYNDLRGPSNSLTMREASANLAVGEGLTTIQRGAANMMLCGSTGTRIHTVRSIHMSLQEPLADNPENPAAACRPFDANRDGMVIGEGAGAIILESLDSAKARGANILGEALCGCSSTVSSKNGVADYETSFFNVIDGCLQKLGKDFPLGHIHAHGLSNSILDAAEAKAINRIFGQNVPVTALKSYMGNLGAGSGLIEMIASLQAMNRKWLFPVLNYQTPDPECPIRIAKGGEDPGHSFMNLNITPQGQASAIVIRRWDSSGVVMM